MRARSGAKEKPRRFSYSATPAIAARWSLRSVLTGLLRQSVFGRLAGYEDVNDAERLSQDPVMRTIVDRKGLDRLAASTSQMGRFETEWLATDDNLAALTDLSGVWIDRVHRGKPPKTRQSTCQF
jgi:hypothetical protein